MSWSEALHDRTDALIERATKGISLLSSYSKFLLEKKELDEEYAAKLKKLSESYATSMFTSIDSGVDSDLLRALIYHCTDNAAQMSIMIQSVKSEAEESAEFANELTKQTQSIQSESTHSVKELKKSQLLLDKRLKKVKKVFNEYQKANPNAGDTASLDKEPPKAAKAKQERYNDKKEKYAKQLEETNNLQKNHYDETVQKALFMLEAVERSRLSKLEQSVKCIASLENQHAVYTSHSLQTLLKYPFDVNEEIEKVLERLKTGANVPAEIPFVDVSSNTEAESAVVLDPSEIYESGNKPSRQTSSETGAQEITLGTHIRLANLHIQSPPNEDGDKRLTIIEPMPGQQVIALYDFKADKSSNTISMKKGEHFILVDGIVDDNGWALVKRLDVLEDGFVPASYLEYVPEL